MILKSQMITIRKTELVDLDFVCSLELNEENVKFIIPWSTEKHEKSINGTDTLHLVIEDSISNHLVGYIILAGINNPNLSMELVRITINDKGKAYGKEVFRLIKDWVFTQKGFNRLWLDVKTDNLRAYHFYQKQGFTVEDTLRECIKTDDKFESLHLMSILKSEFKTKK